MISVKKGKPGKRVKTKESPGLEEVNKEIDMAVEILLEKFNQCHGANGKFCSGSGGKGGGGGGGGGGSAKPSSDLPPWMEAKPKPEAKPVVQPAQVAPTKPAYTPGKRLADGTYLPDSDGKYPYPDNAHARLDLKPKVGQEVKMEYWAENPGTTRKNSRCIRDIKVAGMKEPVAHVWAQDAGPELMGAKWGQKQEAIGVVTAYAKGKPGMPKTMDYSVQPRRATINKEMPLLDADAIIEKFNQCHGANGKFCSGSGGSAGGGGAAAVPTRYETTDGEVVGVIDNQLDIPDEQAAEIAHEIDQIAANAKVKNLHEVAFKELDTNVLAQCEGSWADDGTIKLAIAVNPAARDYATSRYVEDHMKLQQTNQMPWLASANAPDSKAAYKAVMVHEVAHAKMMEHTLNSKTPPINEHNPMHGTKTWGNIINAAHKDDGWQGPSLYGRKNPGECFAECVSLLTIRGSTGNKKVDDYVVRVIQE